MIQFRGHCLLSRPLLFSRLDIYRPNSQARCRRLQDIQCQNSKVSCERQAVAVGGELSFRLAKLLSRSVSTSLCALDFESIQVRCVCVCVCHYGFVGAGEWVAKSSGVLPTETANAWAKRSDKEEEKKTKTGNRAVIRATPHWLIPVESRNFSNLCCGQHNHAPPSPSFGPGPGIGIYNFVTLLWVKKW